MTWQRCSFHCLPAATAALISIVALATLSGPAQQCRAAQGQSSPLPLAPPALAAQPDTSWPPPPRGTYEYADSSGLWRVVGGKSLEKDIRNYEETSAASNQWWPGYEIMVQEPGDWYVFQVGLREGCRVILSSASKIVLVEKKGKTLEGEMRLLRSPDTTARDVWDVLRSPLVVRSGGFMSGSIGPSVAVRFPWGSVNWGEVRSIRAYGIGVLHPQGR